MTAHRDTAVDDYLVSLDEQTANDSAALIDMMHRISGREGDGHTIGFYPRKGKITVYLMDGTARHAALLARLSKHSLTGYCVYIKQLSDVDLTVLEQIVRDSYRFIESLAQHGPIREILWKAGPGQPR